MNARNDTHALTFFSRAVLLRLLALAAAAGTLLACVVWILYFQERSHERALLRQQGLQRIDQEFDFLQGEVETVTSDLLYLADQALLRRFLAKTDDARDASARDALAREYVHFATRRQVYDQIRFLDTAGKEVVRVNYRNGEADIVPGLELQAKSDRYYYQRAMRLAPGEVFVSDFDLNVEHGEIERPLNPVLRFLTPVFDGGGRKRGLLTLNYSGNHLLRRLNEVSLPGSTLLVNSAGHYIRGRSRGEAWGWLLGHGNTFDRSFPTAWKRIAGSTEGQFSTDRGLFTFRRMTFSSIDGGAFLPGDGVRSGIRESAPLILVAYAPPDLLTAGSAKLLNSLLWMYAGAMLLLIALGWYWARSAAIRRDQARSIEASEERLRRLSDRLLTAQEHERRRISRELHDELGQQVTAIGLDLRSAKRQPDATRTRARLEGAIAETDHLLKSIHEFASRVRPPVLDDLGLRDAVVSLTSEIGRRTGVSVTTRLDFREENIPPKIGENIYRILQEGLTNIVKHAATREACVAIERAADQLLLSLEDQGVGFDPCRRDGSRLGILGMQERAELLGGRFDLSSRPGAGTRIEVAIPLDDIASIGNGWKEGRNR